MKKRLRIVKGIIQITEILYGIAHLRVDIKEKQEQKKCFFVQQMLLYNKKKIVVETIQENMFVTCNQITMHPHPERDIMRNGNKLAVANILKHEANVLAL